MALGQPLLPDIAFSFFCLGFRLGFRGTYQDFCKSSRKRYTKNHGGFFVIKGFGRVYLRGLYAVSVSLHWGLMMVSSGFGEGAAAKFTAVGDFSGVDLPG